MTSTSDLHTQWSDLEENGTYVNDLVGTAETVADDAHEPRDTLALACAGATVAEGLGEALDNKWALYTPQDAAVVASAIHAQLVASIGNLRALAAAVEQVAARGDVTMPEPSGIVSPEDENLADAVDRLTTAADEIEANVGPYLLPAVRTLEKTPPEFQAQRNVHENLVAVAKLLGDMATLKTGHADDDYDREDTDKWCGCFIEITRGSELFLFDRSDMGWSLLRDSDGRVQPDGSKVWAGRNELDVHEGLAHPGHLAEILREATEVESNL